jgi:hypothetical protein
MRGFADERFGEWRSRGRVQGFCAAPAHESLKREFANIEARFS